MLYLSAQQPHAALRLTWYAGYRLSLVGLGTFFALAGALKVLIFPTFAGSTATFLSLGPPLSTAAAAVVVGAELLFGLALLANRRVREAGIGIVVLLLVFIATLLHARATGIVAACNCFGSTGLNLSYVQQIIVDLALLPVALFVTASASAFRRGA